MACGLPGIASGIGIDPTLLRDGTDFITLQVVRRIGVWLRLCYAVSLYLTLKGLSLTIAGDANAY